MAFKMDYIVHGSMIENLDQPTSLHLCQDCVVYCFSCTEKKTVTITIGKLVLAFSSIAKEL